MLNTQLSGWEIAGIASTYRRRLTMMRLGYLMSFHPAYGEPRLLSKIENKWRPRHALYWDAQTRRQKGAQLYPRWNLIVPLSLDDALSAYLRSWHC
jgi:hypothetical protein